MLKYEGRQMYLFTLCKAPIKQLTKGSLELYSICICSYLYVLAAIHLKANISI